jgi:hypothetical protein
MTPVDRGSALVLVLGSLIVMSLIAAAMLDVAHLTRRDSELRVDHHRLVTTIDDTAVAASMLDDMCSTTSWDIDGVDVTVVCTASVDEGGALAREYHASSTQHPHTTVLIVRRDRP